MCLPPSTWEESFGLHRIHLSVPVGIHTGLLFLFIIFSYLLSTEILFFFFLVTGNISVPSKLLCWLDSSFSRIWLCTCCHHYNLPLWITMAEKQGSLWLSTALCRPLSFCFYSGFNLVTYTEPKCWTRALWWSSLGFVGHWWSWQWPTMSTGKLWEGWFSVAWTDMQISFNCNRETFQ